MRLASYCRVSTVEQSEEGYSLQAQADAIRAYAASLGVEVARSYVDAGKSAFSDDVADRPAFAALMADVEAGQYDTIVVDQLDRFARSNLVAVQQLRHLFAHGCTLVSLKEQWDFSTASGRFMFQLMASRAEFDSRLKSERVAAAIRQKRRVGGYHGQLPFGSRFAASGALEVDPARADVLRWLLTEAAGRGVHYLAARLTALGVPTRRGNAAWSHSSVWTFLKSGAWLLDQPDPWPTLYRAARDRPRLPHTPAARGVNLLTGLARCACGGVICYSAKRNAQGERYMECRTYARDRPTGRRCPHYGKRTAPHYEAVVTAAILALPPLVAVPEDDATAQARLRLADRRRIAQELYYETGDRPTYEARRAALDAEEAALPLPLPLGAALVGEVARAQALWPLATVAEKNALCRALIARVVICGPECRVEWVPALARMVAAQAGARVAGVG